MKWRQGPGKRWEGNVLSSGFSPRKHGESVFLKDNDRLLPIKTWGWQRIWTLRLTNEEKKKKRKCIFVPLFTSMNTLHDCLFCKPLVKDKGARDTKKVYIKLIKKMLYAINVLKKIIMKEKSYILFWKLKKKNVNIETCMFAKHTLNYVLFDEISLLLLPEISLISVFSTAAIYIIFYYTLSSIFSTHSVGGNLSRLCLCTVYHLRRGCLSLELYVFLLESFAQLP